MYRLNFVLCFALVGLLVCPTVCVSANAEAQTTTAQKTASSRVAFDRQLLRFSEEFDRTILLEDLPEAVVHPTVDQQPETDFASFLAQYDLGSIPSPGLLLIYRKPTKANLTVSVTVGEAAQTLADIEKLLQPFASFPQNDGLNHKSFISRLLGNLTADEWKAGKGEGLLISSLNADNQRLLTTLSNSMHIDRTLSTIRQWRMRLDGMSSPETKISGVFSAGKTVYRAVAPDQKRSVVVEFESANGLFHYDDASLDTFLSGQQVSLSPPYTALGNPLVQGGTIRDVLRLLARTNPERYKSLAVEESLAEKPICIYSLRDTSGERLCKGIATLYNLRVRKADDGFVMARHTPRTITRSGEIQQELLRILPAPLLRLLIEPPPVPAPQQNLDEPDSGESVDLSLYTSASEDTHISGSDLQYKMPAEAVRKLNGLLAGSFRAGGVTEGFASLSDAPGAYNTLLANILMAETLSHVAQLLKETPVHVSHLPEGTLNVMLEGEGKERKASITVKVGDKNRPGHSSMFGITVFSMPEFPRSE
ncbi:MAG: hypothetical protein H8F28_12170 [Fibrella sp.]|nr:hypothetical protein [Armatimonadota bacterium]